MLKILSVVLASLTLATASASMENDIAERLRQWIPAGQPLQLESAANGQLWEVTSGTQIFYVTRDGGFIIPGPLVEAESGANVTEQKLSLIREELLSAQSDDFFLTFPAQKERHRVTVVTDVDCTFCRKLHAQMSDYNERGITLRYVLVSRGGNNAPAFHKAVSAWCAEQPEEAVTRVMNGDRIDAKVCANPLDEHQMLAQELGLTSTPSLILPGGATQIGYLTPDQLAAKLASVR